MPVIYGGKSIRPAPPVSFTESFSTLGDGRVIGSTITATLRGTIVVDKTNDIVTPVQIESRLAIILRKQEELRETFSENGQWFEVQGWDGSAPVKFQAIVQSIDFGEGPWVDRCDYTVVLTGEHFADETPGENNHIESASESWQFEEGEGPHTYRATHTVSAKGKTVFDVEGKQAWEWAKEFVNGKLGLGWSTVKTPWSPNSGHELYSTSSVEPDAMVPFNRVINENVDELDGSYSITETFFVSKDPWWEEYTVATRKELSDATLTNVVNINGVIHGLTPNLHDPEGKLVNAIGRWATVKTLLFSRVSSYLPGVTLNSKHTSQQVDYNVNEGTVSYQYEYNDKKLVNNTYEWFNVRQETGIEDNKTTVTVEGSITGVRYPDDPSDPLLQYQRAYAQFQNVKNLMLARAIAESPVPDLRAFPVSASVTPNKQDGSISYSFSFDNRIPESVRDEFSVNRRFSREDGRTLITVDGTITGMRTANADWPFSENDAEERYQNALAYFQGIEDNIIGLASNYVDVAAVNPVPFGKTVNHVPRGGQLTYSYEFNSNPKPCYEGALSENITITNDAATPLIAIIPILGRKKGPIIQDLGTVKERRLSVTIELVLPVDASTNMCSPAQTPSVDVTAFAPKGNPVYLEQDQTQWTPTNGHYTRTISWIYE